MFWSCLGRQPGTDNNRRPCLLLVDQAIHAINHNGTARCVILLCHASGGTGGWYRLQAQAETNLGKIANEYMSNGEMLPSDVVLSLVTKRLAQRDCVQNGWILDGKTGLPCTVHAGYLAVRLIYRARCADEA